MVLSLSKAACMEAPRENKIVPSSFTFPIVPIRGSFVNSATLTFNPSVICSMTASLILCTADRLIGSLNEGCYATNFTSRLSLPVSTRSDVLDRSLYINSSRPSVLCLHSIGRYSSKLDGSSPAAPRVRCYSTRSLATFSHFSKLLAKVLMDGITRSSCSTSIDKINIPEANVSWSGQSKCAVAQPARRASLHALTCFHGWTCTELTQLPPWFRPC